MQPGLPLRAAIRRQEALASGACAADARHGNQERQQRTGMTKPLGYNPPQYKARYCLTPSHPLFHRP